MDSVSAIAVSIALGAASAAGTEVVSSAVRDAYDRIKTLLRTRFPTVSIDQLERAPASINRRAVLEEDLAVSQAANDQDILIAAKALTDLIQQQTPAAAAQIGIELKDVEAAGLRLSDVISEGSAIRVERAKFSGDIDISGVRSGVDPNKEKKSF